MSKTFFQFSSVSLIDKLSKFIPALFTRISNPSSFFSTLSINSSILPCSSSLNFSCEYFQNFFFNFSNFCSFVPVATIFESKLLNFFTKAFPIPPEAPVIKIFFIF